MHPISRTALAAAFAISSVAANAADWSDTSIGYRTGSKFAEPFGSNSIKKNIFDLNHVSGYKYGSNFFNVDYLMSDSKDPDFAGSGNGAREIYIVYRHTLDMEKVVGTPFKVGPVRGWGITAGFDVNTKDDAGYNSKKQMFVLGPTLFIDVPGFLNVGYYQLWESNAPYSTFSKSGVARYQYKAHGMFNAAWGIALGKDTGFSFEGFANFIASKGKNEFGADTKAETNIDAQVMYDVGSNFGAKGKFKVGFEYQYWKNKFGNDSGGPAGSGAFAKTPMIRAEYHF
jgi:nucleoside-specific outer membrane channel protein Tsx